MKFFDSHSHYNDEKFDEDRKQIIEKTFEEGITKFICAGYDIESSKKSLEIANKYENIYSIVGVSPNDVPKTEKEISKVLDELIKIIKEDVNKKVVAIGEIGLDYYWNKENKEIQKEMFKLQIDIANKYNLPIVIHTREAVDDTLKILKENTVINKGIFHCCPLNRELVKEGLKLGFYISFAGPITFKNSKNATEVINLVPLDKMLVETDSPYLSPEPKRGTRNDSSNIIYTIQKIAEVKNMSAEEVAQITYNNTIKIFKINVN